MQSASAPQHHLLPSIVAVAACGVGLAVGILVGAQASVLIPFAAVAAVGGAAAFLLHPYLGAAVAMSLFYVNIQPILANEHGVPIPVAAVFPLLFIMPLIVRHFTSAHAPVKRFTLYADSTVIWMFAYLVALILSAVRANDVARASSLVIDYIVWGLALYLVIANFNRHPRIFRQTIWALVLAGAFMAGITLFQEITGTYSNTYGGFAPMEGSFLDNNIGEWRTRPAGPVDDANRFAQILLVLVPLGLYCFRVERGWLQIIALGAVTVTIIGVLLTYSRGAGVALILMLPVMAILWQVKPRYIAMGVAAGILVTIIAVPGFVDRMETLTKSTTIVTGNSTIAEQPDQSTLSRATKNLAAMRMFLDHPITGVGPGHYFMYSAEYADNSISSRIDITGSYPHNLYLGLAAEVGILGIVTFLGAFSAALVNLWRVRQQFRHHESGLRSAAEAIMVALVVYAFTAIFLHLSYQRYFWLLLALSGAVVILARRYQEPRTDSRLVD